MKDFKILVTDPSETAPEALTLLEQHDCTTVTSLSNVRKYEVGGLLVRASTIVDADFLNKFTNVRSVICAADGVDNIDQKTCEERGIRIYNAPGSNAYAVAAFVQYAALAVPRFITYQSEQLMNGDWRDSEYMGTELQGKTVGLWGYGKIGKLVERLLRPHNVRILAYHKSYDEHIPHKHNRFVECTGEEALLQQSDIISLHVPLDDSTKNMIGKNELEKMKPTAMLINTARGEVVNEIDLIAALKTDKIAGAALDVFKYEPKVEKQLKELKKTHPGILLTPHIAAYTKEAQRAMALKAVRNFLAYRYYGKSH